MVEIKERFEASRIDGKVVLNSHLNETLDNKEAYQRLLAVEAQKKQQEGNLEQMENALKEGKMEKQISDMKRTLGSLNDLIKALKSQVEPYLEELKTSIRQKVKVAKAKKGYSRLDKEDINGKIMMQNDIFATICTELEIDINTPVVRELKQDFDKI